MKIDRGKSGIRKFLTREELDRIENVSLPNLSLQKVRDLFLFQSYTGLAYVDMDRFDFRNVQLRNGRHVIHDLRQKTKEDFYIVLLPKAMDILEKYGYKLPLISNQQYNLRLKIVGEAAGLNPKMREFYDRIKKSNLSGKVALVAVMRKLLILMYSVCKSKKPYDPEHFTKN